MRKKILLIILSCLLFPISSIYVHATEMMDKFAVRVTIIENGTIHEWEYDSPDKFEYETDTNVYRGEKAEKEVKQIIRMLSLEEETKIEDMLGVLEEKFPNIEHFDARMRNETGQLYTWVWSKEQQ